MGATKKLQAILISAQSAPVEVTGTVTATNPSVGTNGAASPASSTLVGGSDGTDLKPIKVSSAGVVSVDGSAVTQPVSGTVTANAGTGTMTVDQSAAVNATIQDGSIAFGVLSTSFAVALTTGGALKNVMCRNNTNAVVEVSFDSGATTGITLDAGDTVSLDLKSMGLRVASGVTIQAKYTGSAPTSGSIRVNGVY